MTERRHYVIPITVYSYSDIFDKFMKKNNLTVKEVNKRLTHVLQIMAWADAYPEMQNYLDWENSEEGKEAKDK